MNKKESLIKSLAIYRDRIDQVNEKLKKQNLSALQRIMFESEKRIAYEDIKKLETDKIN